jgi:serine/threonine-protein kinase
MVMDSPEPLETPVAPAAPLTDRLERPGGEFGPEDHLAGRVRRTHPDHGREDTCQTGGGGLDPVLTELAEEITCRLQAGERVDIEEYAGRHPEWADQLRRLEPVLRGMAEMGRSFAGVREAGEGGRLLDGSSSEGRVLGDFRVLREVGRGGMAVVYEAEQISLGRRVALKVLPLAAAMDPRALQRFQLEAQAAALLQHPRIVPVYAVGALGDVPYYAMQFIEGASLAELVAALRKLAGLGGDGYVKKHRAEGVSSLARELLSGRLGALDLEEESARRDLRPDGTAADREPVPGPGAMPRPAADASSLGRDYPHTVAHLGVQAAEALEYAHGHGVIHRDVKPANLILDRRGVLWVTDFGLARISGEGGLTLTGDVLGTLRYMSPEQAMARRALVDRRTDIYSLGATLYELLTLHPSVPGSERQEILRHIIENDPLAVRRLNPAVPVDLATVVSKAMCKDPGGRYETAQHFADDLRRFLEGRAIAARPIGLVERAWRWCRRKPLPASLAAGLVAASIGGVVGVTLSWREAVTQRDLLAREKQLNLAALARESKANQALVRANELERASRAQALRRFALAREAVEKYYTGASQEVLLRQPQMESLRKRLLETALSFYKRLQAIIEEGPDDPETRAELASVYQTVGRIAVEVGSRAEGLEALQHAREILETLVRAAPAPSPLRADLASCLEFIGRLEVYTAGRHTQGLRSLEGALRLYQALSDEQPGDPDRRYAVASTDAALGYEHARIGQTAEGLRMLDRGCELLERLAVEQPEATVYRNQLALSYGELGKIQAYAGLIAEALDSEYRALALFEELARDEPATSVYRRRLGQIEVNLGRILSQVNRPAEALAHSERGLSGLEQVADELPAVESYQRAVAECRDVLGLSQVAMGREEEALGSLDQARTTLKRLIDDHPNFLAYQADLAENLLWTGSAYQNLGRAGDARRELSEARTLLGRMLPDGGTLYDLARTESRLVSLVPAGERSEQAARALAALRRAVAHGYRSTTALESDPSFDPLRDRAEFRLLLLDIALPDDPFTPRSIGRSR